MSDLSVGTAADSESEQLREQLSELTDAYVAANDQLLALYRLSEWSSASLDPLVAATRAVEGAAGLLGAARAQYFAVDGSTDEPLVSAGPESTTLGSQDPGHGPGVRINGDQPIIIRDDRGGRCLLSVPVRTEDHLMGTMVAVAHEGQFFSTAELKLAGAICNQLAVIFELSEFHREAVQRSVMERDHDIASTLAQAAMNRSLPTHDHYDFAAFNRPARSAGGDFYAAARSASGVFIALGDVSGKGLPAALIMNAAISATYGAFERHPGDVSGAMLDIDRQLVDYLNETGKFVTLVVAHLDPAAGTIQISNAGHWPVLLRRDGDIVRCTADNPPIGVLDPERHPSNAWQFDRNDLLFIGSDGWTEQENEAGTMFGDDLLVQRLSEDTWPTAADMLDELVKNVDHYAEGVDQADDLTAFVARCTLPKGTK